MNEPPVTPDPPNEDVSKPKEQKDRHLTLFLLVLLVLVLLCILALLVIGLLLSFGNGTRIAAWLHWKLLIASVVGFCALYLANVSIFSSEDRQKRISPGNPELIGKVIAFDVVMFVVVGLVVVIGAAYRWEAACLCGGACLIGGGIVGLLFGMPLGTAQVATTKTDENDTDRLRKTTDDVAVAAKKSKAAADRVASQTLLAQTASSLSKLLAGAGLARFHDVLTIFRITSTYISKYIDPGMGSSALGGALILYFTLLGFLSGLFLPAYFMKNWQS